MPAKKAETAETKSLFSSRTFWVNVLTLVVALLGYLQGLDWIEDNAQLVAIFGMVVGGLNILLRAITDSPVKLPWSK